MRILKKNLRPGNFYWTLPEQLPSLVRFAKPYSPEKLTVVLVPSDRSLDDAAAYLKDYGMPWNGLNTFSGRHGSIIPRNPTRYIPAMVLTDAEGKVLLANRDSLPTNCFLEEAALLIE